QRRAEARRARHDYISGHRAARAARLLARLLARAERTGATGGAQLLFKIPQRGGVHRHDDRRVDFILPRALRERRVPLSQITPASRHMTTPFSPDPRSP